MRNAAVRHGLEELKGLNSFGWAIVGFFAGIVPGIMLLVAHGPIGELGMIRAGGRMPFESVQKAPEPQTLLPSSVNVEYQGGAQIEPVAQQGVIPPPDLVDKLTRLRSLYESGALTPAEYADQKRVILDSV